MNRHITKTGLIAAIIVLTVVLLAGCNSNASLAKEALSNYLTKIGSSDYSGAYNMLSDFDKKYISEDDFDKWRKSVDKVLKKNSFTIGKKYDRFKDYDYYGTTFKDSYGFDVEWNQEYIIEGVEPIDYDKANFKIMVVLENESYKIALFVEDLNERSDYYESLIEN